VVVGPNAATTETWINTLAYFLLPFQRNTSTSLLGKGLNEYIPDLSLQGIVDVSGIDGLSREALLKSIGPSTVVYIGPEETSPDHTQPVYHYSLKQTISYLDFNPTRKRHLESLHDLQFKEVQHEVTSSSDFFRDVEPSLEISEIVDNIFKIDNLDTRQAYITQMMSLLVKKAVVIVKYVQALPQDTPEIPEVHETSRSFTRKPSSYKQTPVSFDIEPNVSLLIPEPRQELTVLGIFFITY